MSTPQIMTFGGSVWAHPNGALTVQPDEATQHALELRSNAAVPNAPTPAKSNWTVPAPVVRTAPRKRRHVIAYLLIAITVVGITAVVNDATIAETPTMLDAVSAIADPGARMVFDRLAPMR